VPKNVSRSKVKEAAKYLRKGNGQFNGSVGSGKTAKVSRKNGAKSASSSVLGAVKVARERDRIKAELSQEQRKRLGGVLAKPSAPRSLKYGEQARNLKKEVTALKKKMKEAARKGTTDPLDAFNLRILEKQQKTAIQLNEQFKTQKADKKLMSLARKAQKKFNAGKPLAFGEAELLPLVATEARLKANKPDRAPIEEGSFKVEGKRLRIWEGKTYGQYKDTTFRGKKEYNYEVGGESLNRNRSVMIHKGETVLGVPNNVKISRNLNNEQLIGELATAMRFVENHDKGLKAPAPYWNANSWGRLPDESRMGKPGQYGQAQLHHINQWAKVPLDSIVKKYEAGEISLEEAKAQSRELLRPTPHGKYEIAAASQKERAYVVLPGGLHDLTSPHYYDLNHPKGIHPDTGEVVKFGLPDKSKSGSEYGLTEGREYHNDVRDSYWGEWHRQNAHAVAGEVNRRLRRGELTPDEFNSIMNNKVLRASK
jgi:hypothetical protein